MEITRRSALSLLSAAGLLTVITPPRAGADPSGDHDRLLANTVAIFAGTPESNGRPAVAEKVADIGDTARRRLAAMACRCC